MSKMKSPVNTVFIIILASILFCGCKDTTDLREGINPPGKATNPLPADTATDVAPTAVLRWQPGENAYMFHIYLGTDRTAVENADAGSPEYRGMVGTPFFNPPGDLSLDTTYYWRVDCANAAAAVKGDTWSFATVVPPPVPVAGFTADPTTGQAPLAVTFTDTSTGLITSWSWDLNGDGSPDSSVRNPSCTYTQAGTFTVSLTVTGPGGADTETKTDYIIVTEPPPVADFIGSPTSGPAPLTVQFTDQSTGTVTQWFWDFNNDGLADSALQNPSQTYLTDGTYSVKLTVVGPSGTDSKTRIDYITVGSAPPPAPSAAFSGTPTSGTAPLVVSYTDESTGSITFWQWDFDNDTVVDSTVQDPTHEYSSAGTYTVSLTVTGPGGNDTETKANYITVTEAPVPPAADFVGSPTEGTSPLTVNFTDLSTGDITSWSWNFGDGGTSTQPNPTHKYTTAGIFTVSLTVDGPAGSDGEVKLNYITVYDAAMPEANFAGDPTTGVAPLAVSFTDLSSGQITSWAWDFDGFGVDSTAQNPTWLFATPGTYDVKLTVSGPGGSDSNIKYSYITVDWPVPVANFTATPTAGLAPLTVSFTDTSSGNITAWEWDFDNDTVIDSYSQNATHTYDSEGIYSVALTVIGPGGEDTRTRIDYISVTVLPKVTGISPAPDEVLSSEPSEILVTFNKEIDASTVNATNFILLASGGDGTFDDGNETQVTLNSVTRIATNIVKMDLFGVSLPDDAYEVSVLGESGFKALDFDIEDDHVYLGKSDVAPPWSAEFWVRREDCPNAAARLMDSANYSLRLEQFNFTNKVGFSWYGAGDYVFNYEAPIDTWVHLAFVGTGSGTSLYVNGILQDTNPNSISLPMESIGASAETIKGTVDEVRLWSIARAGPEIQADMNRILTGSEAGLVGYYRFNEGSGQIVNDSSPLGNHGTRGADANPNTDDPQWVDSTAPIADGVKCVDGYVLDGEFSGSFPSGNNIEGGDFQSLFYIGDMPVANFTATPTDGTEPLLVTFTDQSTGTINSWEWDFNNNGTVDSTVQHPTHIYNAPGMFTVKLTVSGPIGTTSETKGRYIEVESSLANVIYVDDMDGNDTFDGLSWDTAVKTIQTGLNKASDTWTVLVADGTYTGTSNRDLDFTGKDIILKSTSGALNCIIDCEISGRAFYFHSGETNNSIVEGFTIRNGKITGDNGAGMLITNSSSPTISNCIITNCQVVRSSGWTGLGGAVYCESSSPILSGCTVTSNNATYCAGGLFVYNASNPTIIGCKITDNSADGDSGGIYCHTNSAGQITNCLLSGNSCAAGGGGIDCHDASPIITNCTITNNTAGRGGAIQSSGNSSPVVNNCILSGDSATVNGNEVYTYHASSSITLNNCDCDNGTGDIEGPGTETLNSCISLDPQFVNATSRNYRLSDSSPCIDNGSNVLIPPGVTTDLDGNERVIHGTVDIGCYEFVFPTYSANTFDTSPSIDDNNQKVIVESGSAKLAPEGDEFGDTFDSTRWTECAAGDLWSISNPKGSASWVESSGVLSNLSGGLSKWDLCARREVSYADADIVTEWKDTDCAHKSYGAKVMLYLWRNYDNCVMIYYLPRNTSGEHRVRVRKLINGVDTLLFNSGDLGLQPKFRLRIKRSSSSNTFTFYYATWNTGQNQWNTWQDVWSGTIDDATYFNTSHALYPIIDHGADSTEDFSPEIDRYYQNTTDGIPAQWFWDNSPECGVVDSGVSDWAFDAGAGKNWELAGASCVKSEPGTSTVLFKVGYSDTGNDADVTWVDAAWQTIAQVDTNAAAGNYDGHRYIHVKVQFNSDGTDQPTLSSFSISGRKAVP